MEYYCRRCGVRCVTERKLRVLRARVGGCVQAFYIGTWCAATVIQAMPLPWLHIIKYIYIYILLFYQSNRLLLKFVLVGTNGVGVDQILDGCGRSWQGGGSRIRETLAYHNMTMTTIIRRRQVVISKQ